MWEKRVWEMKTLLLSPGTAVSIFSLMAQSKATVQ